MTYHLFVVWTISHWTYKGERIGSFSLQSFMSFEKKNEDLSDVTVLNSELANHKPCLLPLYLSILGLQATELTWLRRLRRGKYKHKHNPIYAIYATCRLLQLQKYFPTFGCTNLITISTQIHLRLEPWLLDMLPNGTKSKRNNNKKLLVDVNLWRKFLMCHPRLCWHCQGILAYRSSQVLTVFVVFFPLLSSRISRRSSPFFC